MGSVILTVILGAGSAIAVMPVGPERSDSAAGQPGGDAAYGSVEVQMTVDVPLGTPPDGYRFYVTHGKRVPEMYHGSWFQIQVV